MAIQSFDIFHGNDKTLYIQVIDEESKVVDLNGMKEIEWIIFQGENALLKKTLTQDQIVIIDAVNGKFKIDVNNKDSLLRPSTYSMVVRLYTNDDKVHTIVTGNFVVKQEH